MPDNRVPQRNRDHCRSFPTSRACGQKRTCRTGYWPPPAGIARNNASYANRHLDAPPSATKGLADRSWPSAATVLLATVMGAIPLDPLAFRQMHAANGAAHHVLRQFALRRVGFINTASILAQQYKNQPH